ncbi:hypothetical protein [Paenibacillus koleovorans]|uniref:hypothetical protein n=1 Tax=Paenibacillus koleovorans TaxID=121608 RepID=UPI000FD76A37|nr:hypothetical protein [Paenibacillus koleovorans]
MPEWDSTGKPKRQVLAVDGGPIDISADQMEPGSVSTSQLAAKAVTLAKALVFVSAEQTGTGSAQNVAHGLAVVPAAVLVVPTDLTPSTVGQYSVVEGTHTNTNVVLTVTTGKKFKVLAWG